MISLLLTTEEKELIASENFTLVYYVANSFRNTRIDLAELVSIGVVGYAKALNAYDTTREVKFSTFAINCIQNEILFFLRKEKKHMQNNISMNLILSTDKNGNSLNMEDIVSEESGDTRSLEEGAELNSDIYAMRMAIKDLSPKEQYIVTYRFGLDRGIIKTQSEIAEIIDMSQANVSKIEKNILVKMENLLKNKYHMDGDIYK